MAYREFEALASAARTTSSQQELPGPGGYGDAKTLTLHQIVSAASGTTPTLDVVVEDTLDGGTTWVQVAAFTQSTAAGSKRLDITSPFADRLRVRWTIAGTTPSFTFKILAAIDDGD